MADPLSIISLLATGASLTRIILKYASSVKDVPKELKSLRDELSELQNVFEELLKIEESKEGTQDIADIIPHYSAAEVGVAPCAFPTGKSSDLAIPRLLSTHSRASKQKSTKPVQQRAFECFPIA